ncbi:MAG: MarR family transcriptional regulator [Hyphomicrobiales bacterium]|nr:MarR family transcriptional regulator [Hyphomicrobiales bacterium]
MTFIHPPADPDEPLGILFSDVARLFWRRLEQAFAAAGHDMRSAELRVLMTVVDRPGERQSRLAEALFIEPMTLVGHLDRLEKKGFVERRPDPADRRAKRVHPTPAAAPALELLRAASAEVRAAQVARLADDEIPILRDLLQRVRAGLAGREEPGR